MGRYSRAGSPEDLWYLGFSRCSEFDGVWGFGGVARSEAYTIENIKAEFKVTGIFPSILG